ncbi:hypothetical protein RB195_023997 [Necator americanus]|uniref:Mos1 transposase HTH domain-containing protein n=1 Tax=Necator americanus TaxID=51031 RepID=A0ABR1ELE1_NECAM
MPRNFKPSSLHLRNVIIFLHLSGQEPADIDRRLKEVYEEHAPSRSTVYKWHSKFASGDYSIEYEDRLGHPMELDFDLMRRQGEADPYQTTRDLAVALGVSQTTVVRELKSIGKVRKLGRWVPHALTQYEMDCRADTALSLLTLKRTHTWLEHLVTGDEKWISYSNIHRRVRWVDKGTDAEDIPKLDVHTRKVFLFFPGFLGLPPFSLSPTSSG